MVNLGSLAPTARFIAFVVCLLFAEIVTCQNDASMQGKPIVGIFNGGQDLTIEGETWTPTDTSEKPDWEPTWIVCKKRINVCASATDGHASILLVSSWTLKRMVMTQDDPNPDPCWANTVYIVDLTRSVVSRIQSLRRRQNLGECRWAGPKRSVYRLSHSQRMD